jgi:hypothetical protein
MLCVLPQISIMQRVFLFCLWVAVNGWEARSTD